MKTLLASTLLCLLVVLPGCGKAPSIAVGEAYAAVESRLQKHGAKEQGRESAGSITSQVTTWKLGGDLIKVSQDMGKVTRIEVASNGGSDFKVVQELPLTGE